MKLSARNVLQSTIKNITLGAVDAEIVVELSEGLDVVAVITQKSAAALKLEPGSRVYAVIKASNVLIGVD